MKNLLLIIVGWLVLDITAQAASFGCAQADSKVEHLICDNPEISRLDDGLAASYQAALQNESQAGVIKQVQKRWVKERNSCTEAGCVKAAYASRLPSLAVTNETSEKTVPSKQDVNDNSQSDLKYHFQLTKGSGIPVCDAYLQRLNTTEFEKPPYCGRPENAAVAGFARLNRASLSPRDIHDLYPIIWSFVSLANRKNIDWSSIDYQQRLTQTYPFKAVDQNLLQMDMDGGWAKVWRYDPPIDIDNDGLSDNVEIWHGSALPTGVGGRQCGDDISDINGTTQLLHQPQIAFVTTANNSLLDVMKTEKIFGHPKGGYRIHVDGKWIETDGFRPIGNYIGIFKYQALYYFDTFFDSWGDIHNKRLNDKNIGNTLAVFLHKNGKTRQVCEYLMTE